MSAECRSNSERKACEENDVSIGPSEDRDCTACKVEEGETGSLGSACRGGMTRVLLRKKEGKCGAISAKDQLGILEDWQGTISLNTPGVDRDPVH
jgi:hypothetical protein